MPGLRVEVSFGEEVVDEYLAPAPRPDPGGLSASQLLITRRKIRSAARRRALVELDRGLAERWGVTLPG